MVGRLSGDAGGIKEIRWSEVLQYVIVNRMCLTYIEPLRSDMKLNEFVDHGQATGRCGRIPLYIQATRIW